GHRRALRKLPRAGAALHAFEAGHLRAHHRALLDLRARRPGRSLAPHPQLVLAVPVLVLKGDVMHFILIAALLAQEIKVGGLFDLTGITSDVGKSFAQGVRDAVSWTNDNGGINGKKIKLVDVDYG